MREDQATTGDDDRRTRRILRAARDVARADAPAHAAVALREALLDTLGSRAVCLFYDEDGDELWSPSDAEQGPDAGRIVPDARALIDDRDSPREIAGPRELIGAMTTDLGKVHGVLWAAREPDEAEFDDFDRDCFARLCHFAAPGLAIMGAQLEIDARAGDTLPGQQGTDEGQVYRAEALAAYAERRELGELPRIDSAWITWCYRALVLLLVVGGAYLWFTPVGEYANGTAMVRLGGRVEATAATAASVAEVMVATGDTVVDGQPIVRLRGSDERAELRRIELELDAQLRRLLRDPDDTDAKASVAELTAAREQAELRNADLLVRAPRAGIVHDLRARPGQAVAAGDVLASIGTAETDARVVALLPGEQRPRLQTGMPIRVEFDGHRASPQWLWVEQIDDDVVSTAEAERVLGTALGDDRVGEGAVVKVTARLEGDGFVTHGRHHRYHDGMRGRAEVRVRSTSILEALIPALEEP